MVSQLHVNNSQTEALIDKLFQDEVRTGNIDADVSDVHVNSFITL